LHRSSGQIYLSPAGNERGSGTEVFSCDAIQERSFIRGQEGRVQGWREGLVGIHFFNDYDTASFATEQKFFDLLSVSIL
jgi:hypothetical protein